MKSYFISVFISAVFILIIQILAESQMATKSYVHFISGLVTILVLFNPFITVVKDLVSGFSISIPEAPQYSVGDGNQLLLSDAEKSLAQKIQSMIEERYDASTENVKVTLQYDEKRNIFYIQAITVILDDMAMVREIEAYLKDQFTCEINVNGGE